MVIFLQLTDRCSQLYYRFVVQGQKARLQNMFFGESVPLGDLDCVHVA